jgi:oxygen-independent coproporphyrinogen-3 oxidase
MAERVVIPLVPASQLAKGGGIALRALPPLALYVHFPWCVRKCPYCDFNSHEVRGSFPETDYLDALISDLEQALPNIWGRRVVSIFIGGGTPSLLSEAGVERLLSTIRTLLPLDPEAEITLEANPGTVEAAKFSAFRGAGVNRISLGIQSFNPRHLQALSRIHTTYEAHRAVELALREYDNVNLDLMYGLPEQHLEEARADIETAARFGSAHLSAYQLSLEPNTLFHRQPPALPDADLAADMQDLIEETLAQRGYEHYETSAFARPGSRCRHNLNYWQFGDYLGIGAGAHGKLSYADRITREVRHKHPQTYIEHAASGNAIQEAREVGRPELAFEFMMNALRLNQGFSVPLFNERTGLPLAAIGAQLASAQARGLIEVSEQRIAPTPRGRRFLNDLLQLFLPDAPTKPGA